MKPFLLLFLITLCFTIVNAWNPFPEGAKVRYDQYLPLPNSWPEVVGMNSARAAEIIRDECTDCSVRIQHVVSVHLDYLC